MTTIRPSSTGSDPRASPRATIRPQIAIGSGIGGAGAQGGHDRGVDADIAIQQHGKRHHADRQHQQREQKADADAGDDQLAAGLGGEHVVIEGRQRDDSLLAHGGAVERVGGDQPEEEDREQAQAQNDDGAESRGGDDAEGIAPADRRTLLAAPAHLVEADRGNRTEQREARNQREQQRNEIVVERRPSEDQTGQRVDQAQEDHVATAGGEVLPALGQRVAQIRDVDLAHDRQSLVMRRLASTQGIAGMADRGTGGPELVHAPFDGIADMVPITHGGYLRYPGRGARRDQRPEPVNQSLT